MLTRRLGLLAIAAAVIAMTAYFWKNDPFTAGILILVDLLLGFFLLSGWRQIAQEERDRAEIKARQESQRRYAAEMPRDDRREVATQLPAASDDDEDADD